MSEREFQRCLDDIVAGYYEAEKLRGWFVVNATELGKIPAYAELRSFGERGKAEFMLWLVKTIIDNLEPIPRDGIRRITEQDAFPTVHMALFFALMRTKASFTSVELVRLFHLYREAAAKGAIWTSMDYWPHGLTIVQLQKSIKRHALTEETAQQLREIAAWKEFDEISYGTNLSIYRAKLHKVVDEATGKAGDVRLYKALGGDGFGEAVTGELDGLNAGDSGKWHALLHHAATAKGARPGKKFVVEANRLIEEIGTTAFKAAMHRWLDVTVQLSLTEKPHPHYPEYFEITFLTRLNTNLLKGLVWIMDRFHDEKSLLLIANLAQKTYEKVPGQGPVAPSLGNACVYVLAHARGLSGVSHLSRLKLRIRQPSTQKLIQDYIDQRAEDQGLKPAQIEEVAAPDFGLENGRRTDSFDDYSFEIEVVGAGSVSARWLNADGKEQKSVPATVKSSKALSKRLTDLRNIVKQIKQASTAQRDRIDRLYVEDMTWTVEDVEKYYIHHGLVCFIARKLIWTLTTGNNRVDAINTGDGWQDIAGKPVGTGPSTTARLWHPIDSETSDVLAWRARLEALEITQPLKQAYREVYLLTDAELTTRTYSNRMAAHILKQHQFNALTGVRGWKFSLMGCYDDGRDTVAAQKRLPQHGLVAEYWIVELGHDDEGYNDAGIWHYVATDQVCFRGEDGEPVELVGVPKIVFSEMMRDADLFVGVASVGNDPQWMDGGGATAARDYWTSYSFGDLSELAKTRKQVLENLLPRLKLRDVAHIEGRFLLVDGKRHTYKIHIGSTNILIAPGDKYLCIVPGRGRDKKLDKLYLPFEGDRGLSLLLSKAFMLAEDDKITDTMILSQL